MVKSIHDLGLARKTANLILETRLNHTFFDTPALKHLLRLVSLLAMKVLGWKVEGDLPRVPKFVMIAAPHTSNWDLPNMLFFAFYYRAKIYWMGKHTIFKKPFGTICKWMGGIPVDRKKSRNMVEQSVEQLKSREKLVLVVPPTGTRERVLKWKTGFYYIALQAGVPIALGFLDYKRKVGGFGPLFHPTGDIEADMEIIMEFYRGITGKYPEKSIITIPELKPGSVKPAN